MTWQHLSLRTRLFLGYGLLLLITAALIVYLIAQSSALNTRLQAFYLRVTHEVTTSLALEEAVTTTEQAIDRYLQQPQPTRLTEAQAALRRLEEATAQSEEGLYTPGQQERLAELKGHVASYKASFESLNELLADQADTRSALSTGMYNVSLILNDAITGYLATDQPNPLTMNLFVQAFQQLFQANSWSARMFSEEAPALDTNALDALNTVQSRLTLIQASVDPATGEAVARALDDVSRSSEAVRRYAANLRALREQRSRLLETDGIAMHASANAIRRVALESLSTVTIELEQQDQQSRRLAVIGLCLTLLVAGVAGALIARTITRPLAELAGATRRISAGSYDVTVPVRDQSETGVLGEAFNHMTTMLREQRSALLSQQEALAERNQGLEQALEALRQATDAQHALEQTVQEMSIPVLPILDHALLVPLVGAVDHNRADQLMTRLLAGVEAHRARMVILDITGVPLVDAGLVGMLVNATSAVRLLGGRCVIVGINPEVAQTLVSSGFDLSNLATQADLHSAVAFAARQQLVGARG